jgi:hypothetical protein
MRSAHNGNATLSIVALQRFSLQKWQLEFPPEIEA